MTLIEIIVFLICIGFFLWLVQLIPMNGRIHQLITGLVVLFCVLFVIQSLGIYNFGLKLGFSIF